MFIRLCVLVRVHVARCAPAEFFDLISKAQSHRADDQRGLLNESHLQLPDFLRLSPDDPAASSPRDPEPGGSAPNARHPNGGGRRGNKPHGNGRGGAGSARSLGASHQSQSLDSTLTTESWKPRPPPLFSPAVSLVHPSRATPRTFQDSARGESIQMLEEDTLSDLTLVGEGDINSPSLDYVTPSALPSKPPPRPRPQAQDGRRSSGTCPV